MKSSHWTALILMVAVSIVAELLTPHDADHAAHWWSGIPAFSAFFGFVGCGVLILFSKAVGKFLLLKKEDYYDVD